MTKTTKYSDRANPRRGYHDFITVVEFDSGTEEEQRIKVTECYQRETMNDMWASQPVKVRDNVWQFEHGYDSGG